MREISSNNCDKFNSKKGSELNNEDDDDDCVDWGILKASDKIILSIFIIILNNNGFEFDFSFEFEF